MSGHVHTYTSLGSRVASCVAIVMESTFCVEAMVRSYHVYKGIRIDLLEGTFRRRGSEDRHCRRSCSQENMSVCSLFLRKNGGTIMCIVTRSRRYSRYLPSPSQSSC